MLFFICTRGGWEGERIFAVADAFFGCGGICKSGVFAVADAFFDAVISAWLGYLISQMLFRCGGICKSGVFDIADAFFDAAVSARVGYSLLRMLFPCHSCIIASAIYLFHDLQILTST